MDSIGLSNIFCHCKVQNSKHEGLLYNARLNRAIAFENIGEIAIEEYTSPSYGDIMSVCGPPQEKSHNAKISTYFDEGQPLADITKKLSDTKKDIMIFADDKGRF